MTPEFYKAVLLVESVHRQSQTGRINWDEVAKERNIVSAVAARCQYQRLIARCKKAEEELATGGSGGGGGGVEKEKKRKAGAEGKVGKSGGAKRGKKVAAEEGRARGGIKEEYQE